MPPTNAQMLDWIADYVTQLNSLECGKPGHYKLEMIASNGEDLIIVTRVAKTSQEALRKCVTAGMRYAKFPLP